MKSLVARHCRRLVLMAAPCLGLLAGHLTYPALRPLLHPAAVAPPIAAPRPSTAPRPSLPPLPPRQEVAPQPQPEPPPAPPPETAPADAPPAPAPPTIPLRGEPALLGTIAGENPAAVVRAGGGVQTLRPGQEWPGMGRIEHIERNRLLLRQPDGQMVRLRPTAAGNGQPAAAMPKVAGPPAVPPAAAPAPTADADGISQLGPGQWRIGPAAATGRRVDVAALLQQGQLVQHVAGGKTEGYTVLRPGPVLQRLGVARGDIVVQVNGAPLTGPEQAREVLAGMASSPQIVLEVMRGQQRLTLEYDLR